ncbi:MAG: hypothetical protein ACK5JD_14600 [Mangrovibacterium sp.]
MNKHFKYKLLGIFIVLVSISSCDTLRTTEQDASDYVLPNGYPKATFATSVQSGATVSEGDTIQCVITIDQMIDRSLTYSAKVVGGTSDDADIEVTEGIIAPYTLSTTVEVVIPQDWDAEETEEMQLEIAMYSLADKYLVDSDYSKTELDLTVENYVADNYTITFNWSKEITVEELQERELDAGDYTIVIEDTVEVVVDAADEVDFDMLLADSEGFDINDVWATTIEDAATGDHPEVIESSGLPDGDYVLGFDLWTNGLAYYLSIVDSMEYIPITVTLTRQGTDVNQTIVQPSDLSILTTAYGSEEDNYYTGAIARLTVADGVYSLSQYMATRAARQSISKKNSRPANIAK